MGQDASEGYGNFSIFSLFFLTDFSRFFFSRVPVEARLLVFPPFSFCGRPVKCKYLYQLLEKRWGKWPSASRAKVRHPGPQ